MAILVRPLHARRTGRTVATTALLIASLLAGACTSRDERVQNHLERANAYLAEGLGTEAVLELRNAAQLAPDDLGIILRVANISADQGFLGDAIDFYRDANQLAPEDGEIAIKLARVLLIEEPERSLQLMDGLIEREPENVGALIVRAHAAIAGDDLVRAVRDVELARQLDPDAPEVSWGQARVYEARIKAAKKRDKRRMAPNREYENALRAYDAYIEVGGERTLSAMLARAQLLAGWPDHENEAEAAYLNAIRKMHLIGTQYEKVQLLRSARLYAHSKDLKYIARRVFQAWTRIEPANLALYEEWAELERPAPDETDPDQDARYHAVYRALLKRRPDDPAANVIYARHVARAEDFNAGVNHLRALLDTRMDEAVLLEGIADIQLSYGRTADASITIAELERRFPGRPQTGVLAARQLVATRDLEGAADLLDRLVADHPSPEASLVLAQVEMRRGRYDAAMKAAGQSVSHARGNYPEGHRLLASLLLRRGNAAEAIVTLKKLRTVDGLTTKDMLLLVQAYYDNQQGAFGRKLLIELLDRGKAMTAASLELYRREVGNRYRRHQIHEYLQAAHARRPRNVDLIAALVDLDIRDGTPLVAIRRLEVARRDMPGSARVRLLRAKTGIALGRYKAAADDAEQALRLSPHVADEAIGILVQLYAGNPDFATRVDQLESLDASGRLPANQVALLARLQVEAGHSEAAIETYERALASGSNLTMLKNDLAFLLADSGRELDRALVLAREAADADDETLNTIDTLGFVYLQSGQYEAALLQFQYAIANTDPPVAEYFYHLALTFEKLERRAEARYALTRALAIDPQYSDAAEALRSLQPLESTAGLGASGAS